MAVVETGIRRKPAGKPSAVGGEGIGCMSAAGACGKRPMSNRRSSTNLLPRHGVNAAAVSILYSFFSRKKLSKWWSNAFAVAALRRRARVRAHAVAFARDHGADAASEDAKKGRRRKRRDPRGPRDPIAERHLARREIARRPEGTKLRVVQQRVAVRVLRRGRQGARGAGVPQVRVVLSRRAVRSSLTRRRRRGSRAAVGLMRAQFHHPRAPRIFSSASLVRIWTRARRAAAETTSSGDRTPNATRAAPRSRFRPLPRLTSSLPHRSAKVYGTAAVP